VCPVHRGDRTALHDGAGGRPRTRQAQGDRIQGELGGQGDRAGCCGLVVLEPASHQLRLSAVAHPGPDLCNQGPCTGRVVDGEVGVGTQDGGPGGQRRGPSQVGGVPHSQGHRFGCARIVARGRLRQGEGKLRGRVVRVEADRRGQLLDRFGRPAGVQGTCPALVQFASLGTQGVAQQLGDAVKGGGLHRKRTGNIQSGHGR
jgi:hypothetical protein